jgi:hypothetical protein
VGEADQEAAPESAADGQRPAGQPADAAVPPAKVKVPGAENAVSVEVTIETGRTAPDIS